MEPPVAFKSISDGTQHSGQQHVTVSMVWLAYHISYIHLCKDAFGEVLHKVSYLRYV